MNEEISEESGREECFESLGAFKLKLLILPTIFVEIGKGFVATV